VKQCRPGGAKQISAVIVIVIHRNIVIHVRNKTPELQMSSIGM